MPVHTYSVHVVLFSVNILQTCWQLTCWVDLGQFLGTCSWICCCCVLERIIHGTLYGRNWSGCVVSLQQLAEMNWHQHDLKLRSRPDWSTEQISDQCFSGPLAALVSVSCRLVSCCIVSPSMFDFIPTITMFSFLFLIISCDCFCLLMSSVCPSVLSHSVHLFLHI